MLLSYLIIQHAAAIRCLSRYVYLSARIVETLEISCASYKNFRPHLPRFYDAIRLTGLAIDTARYQLAPGNRAFGVRIDGSCAGTFEETSRSIEIGPAGKDGYVKQCLWPTIDTAHAVSRTLSTVGHRGTAFNKVAWAIMRYGGQLPNPMSFVGY